MTTQNSGVKFLIAGAGGQHGATGNHVARQLLARKLPVRAFVFHADERSERLAALGAEVVVGDLHDIEVVHRAMRGVTRAYFVYPLAEGLLEAITIFAAAAKEAKVEFIVNMSQITARADFPSEVARQYWLGERIFDWSGIGVTHLEPTLFLENWLVFAGAIRKESKIFLPYGQGKSAPVCAEDVARVIVNILVDPASHKGKTYVPTGPRSLTMSELAAAFGRVLGRSIEYVDVPIAPWAQALAQFRTPYVIEYLTRVSEAHQRGELDVQNDIVQQIGGAPARTPEAFVAENRAAFGG
ncbi:MAG TPA: NmrA family NAD(P)-binding protein [Steroidobacteraceae bacterium]|nr:NmrA family NAD(P)-binding protein [Steroidobacteraceae bacterium]